MATRGGYFTQMLNVPQKRFYQLSKMLRKITNEPTEVDLICSSSKDHDPEDKKHAEPDLPDDGRVRLDLVQERGQKTPLSHGL